MKINVLPTCFSVNFKHISQHSKNSCILYPLFSPLFSPSSFSDQMFAFFFSFSSLLFFLLCKAFFSAHLSNPLSFLLQFFTATELRLTHLKTKVESAETYEESKKQDTTPPWTCLYHPLFSLLFILLIMGILISSLLYLTEQETASPT